MLAVLIIPSRDPVGLDSEASEVLENLIGSDGVISNAEVSIECHIEFGDLLSRNSLEPLQRCLSVEAAVDGRQLPTPFQLEVLGRGSFVV